MSDQIEKPKLVTLVDARRPFLVRIWRGLISLATVAAAASAAFSAYQTREIASGIAREETFRSQYEKDKYTADVVNRYNDYITKAPPFLRCRTALLDLPPDDFALLMDIEKFPEFKVGQDKQKSLIECLSPAERLNIQNVDGTLKPWTPDYTHSVRNTVIDRLNQVDNYLLSYVENIGNKRILCEYAFQITKNETSDTRKLIA